MPVTTSKSPRLSEKGAGELPTHFEPARVLLTAGSESLESNPTFVVTPAEGGSTTLSSEGTQTDTDDGVSVRIQSPSHTPSHSRSNSRTRMRAPIATWHDQLRTRLAAASGRSTGGPPAPGDRLAHLAAPAADPLNRPATPRADLYKGQSEANFGMTFEDSSSKPYPRRCNKPTASPYNYEDKKHRMLMDWLERRGRTD